MIDKYMDEQPLATTLLKNSLSNNKFVQAYMFYHDDMEYLLDYAKEFSKDLVTYNMPEDVKKKIHLQIDNNIYNELMIIKPVNNIIKKEQIVELKNFISTKPIEGKKKIYILKNCEQLTQITANSMLKFIEEANPDTIAIFLTNNIDLVIPTIKSRCQVLNFEVSNSKKQYKFLNLVDIEQEKIENFIENTVNFVKFVEENGINTYYNINKLVYENFSEKENLSILIDSLLYFYYDVFNYKILKNIKYFSTYEEIIRKISEMNLNVLINKIFKLEKIKTDNIYNLNKKLLIDRIVLELCEV